jgi:multidrug efflux pump subunit AcrA (membrane-fusion protein)
MSPRLLPSLALVLALAACQDKAAQQAPTPDRPVLVQVVRFEARAPERSFVATIRPRVESDLGFRVAGKVARRLANVGDEVRAGAPLAVLDDTDLRLQFEQAEAEARAATAALAQADAELRARHHPARRRLVDGVRLRPAEGRRRGSPRPRRPGRAGACARRQRALLMRGSTRTPTAS